MIIIVIIITFIARIIIAITNIYSSKNDLLLPKFWLFRYCIFFSLYYCIFEIYYGMIFLVIEHLDFNTTSAFSVAKLLAFV